MRRLSVFRLLARLSRKQTGPLLGQAPRVPRALAAEAAPASPTSLPVLGGPSCGADAPSGLLIFRAFDAMGKAAHPSLALAGPDGAVRGGVDIPDPREIVATPSGCRAVVRSGTGATFVVDVAPGTAIELDLGYPVGDLRYDSWVGGGR